MACALLVVLPVALMVRRELDLLALDEDTPASSGSLSSASACSSCSAQPRA